MSSKKQSFLKGAAILAIAGIISKILGAIYRIPIGNIIGGEGFAYYQTAYTLYIWMLAFSSYSIPVAISKLVSEKIEMGRRDEAHKIFKVSSNLLAVLGIILSVFLFSVAGPIVNLLKNPDAYIAVVCVSPAIFLVSLSGAFRGYFQGMQNMTPSAVSQVTEQIARVIFGFILAIAFLPWGMKVAAGGAVLGTTIAGLTSLLTLLYIYSREKSKIREGVDACKFPQKESTASIIRRIVIFSVPITIGGSIMPIMNVLDTFIVMDRLQAAGFTYETAKILFGQLTGMAGSFINLPQVFTISLAASLVPAISESIARKNLGEVRRRTELAIRISLLIGLPAAAGLYILADPIMTLAFPKETATAGMALRYLAPAVVFLTLVQTMTGILQGMGKEKVPVINMIIGALTKAVLSYTLTSIPAINVRGAAIGTVAGYAVSTILNMAALLKYQNQSALHYGKALLKPVIATVFMTATAYFGYNFVYDLTMRNSIATLASMAAAALVYAVVIVLIKGVTKEELEMAGGAKLSRILGKKGYLK